MSRHRLVDDLSRWTEPLICDNLSFAQPFFSYPQGSQQCGEARWSTHLAHVQTTR
jgi:hypothetical protein